MYPLQPRPAATAPGIASAPPVFARARRVVIRARVAHLAGRIVEELGVARTGSTPPFVRLDRLTARYAALGGDTSRLAHLRRRRPAGHDRRMRRELAARHDRLAHQYEVGGSWSDLH